MLDTGYRHDMTFEQATDLARRAIFAATHRDAYSGGTVRVYHIDKDGWKRISEDDSMVNIAPVCGPPPPRPPLYLKPAPARADQSSCIGSTGAILQVPGREGGCRQQVSNTNLTIWPRRQTSEMDFASRVPRSLTAFPGRMSLAWGIYIVRSKHVVVIANSRPASAVLYRRAQELSTGSTLSR